MTFSYLLIFSICKCNHLVKGIYLINTYDIFKHCSIHSTINHLQWSEDCQQILLKEVKKNRWTLKIMYWI